MAWRYDPVARRYRDSETGRFLSRARAHELLDQSRTTGQDEVTRLAGLLAGGQIDPSDWRIRMRQEIKAEVIRQYLLGRGGRSQMMPSDWGRVGGIISEQYRYLDRNEGSFYAQVLTDELSEGTIAHRSRMYINSTREAYERALITRLRGSPFDEERWFLGAAENCADCSDLAARGWVPKGSLGTMPGAGQTACLTNCHCHIRYRESATGKVFEASENE
jgi:hypothetical protein